MDFIALERSVAAANYDPLPVVLTEAKGVWVTDTEGRRYLDMMSAYSAVSLGHGHPRILNAMMFGTSPADPLVLVSTTVFFIALGIAGGVIPARRAASVDPVIALRID